MKKILFFAAVAAMVLTTASCNKSYKADLKTDIDSLSYEFGVGTGSQLKQMMAQQGVDTMYIEDLMDGIRDGIKAQGNEKKRAYVMGLMAGLQSADQINENLLMGSKNDKISFKNFMAGLNDGSKHNFKTFDPNKDYQKFQEQAMMIQAKMKENIKKENEDFLKEYAKGKDVKKLPSGVVYKVLKEGKGALPTDSSEVTFKYEGKTIDGKVFDSNMDGESVTATPREFIPGMGDALKNMPAGSKWEICIPQDQAYGEQGGGGKIKPFSTLIFTVEVEKVEEAKPQVQMPQGENVVPETVK
ncbi:MAG: FKBP-type peptidyl-prolyl cis-trans isomerase [Prevotella sp.]|nr:FKBP-type peptidyl-prolyl cis-trans isomerase [Prevotella sp.]